MGVDFISRLPEPILHHILSSLSFREIARTSTLSKTWYQVWNRFQIWEFDFSALYDDSEYFNRRDISVEKIKDLYGSAEKILFRQHELMTDFNKFELIISHIYDAQDCVTTMNRWIGYAIDGQVKDLTINVSIQEEDEEFNYDVPQSVFNAKCIQKLHLCGYVLKLPCPDNVKLSLLKRLHLERVHINDNLIGKFLFGNPLIEDLSIIDCYGLKNLHVFGLVVLESIHVEDLDDLVLLKIDSPSLQSMHLEGSSWPSQVDVSSCKNLKQLSLSRAPITETWLREILKNNPLLQSLSLFSCDMLERIKISSCHLRKLSIRGRMMLLSFKIDVPVLCDFSYEGYMVPLSVNTSVICKVNLFFYDIGFDSRWYVRLIGLLSKFNESCNVLKLTFLNDECCIVPRELREDLAPPLCNIKEMNLLFYQETPCHPTANLVDSMLWIAPHMESLSINSMIKSSFRFSYKQPLCREKSACYKSLPVSCWWSCIKDIKIEQIFCNTCPSGSSWGLENKQIPLRREYEERNYAFDEDVWGKIEGGLLDWIPDCVEREYLSLVFHNAVSS